ncbi:RNA polymerase II-binding domain-containing protein [Xylariaceae sp. FL0016]|nr:RNA polymerase II-binding domain-containing protein [Xylariaceae sp. FL0016]
MSYNDDAVLAKLSALSETQDSIVTVAQWIMFHRRHAERTVQLWLQKLKDSSSHKRLNLIYLANEVSQQSKARHKEEFLVAFSPSIAEGVATAYKGAPQDVQQRIRRVVDVWKERGVFEVPIQDAVEARIQDLDKARGAGKPGLGGSIFGSASSTPSELIPLVTPQQNVTKLLLNTKTAISSADQDFDNLMGPSATVPSAPVYAARLSGLLKKLAQAEGAVEQCVKARRELVSGLQKILDANRNALIADEDQLEGFMQKKGHVEDRKNEVERAIMAGLPNDEPYISGNGHNGQVASEPDRPEVEELTPPPGEPEDSHKTGASAQDDQTWSPNIPQEATFQQTTAPGIEMLSSLAAHQNFVPTAANGSKKRRLEDSNDFPDLGGDDGIDADVAEMLRKDSTGGS